jgi:hypothetical protein
MMKSIHIPSDLHRFYEPKAQFYAGIEPAILLIVEAIARSLQSLF